MPDGKLRAYYWDVFTVHRGPKPVAGRDEALPLDILRVDFATILSKVREHLRNQPATNI